MGSSADILGGLAPATFLGDHWQKRPLLVRGAISEFPEEIEADELAGLACEDEVESRLIRHDAGHREWTVTDGPLPETAFRDLGDRNWTLLVQDVEKHVPELAWVLDRFDFIPRWRIDDLMISFAATGGTVGPHLDAYDVFLIQASGRRRWQIGSSPDRPRWRAGQPLRILEEFSAEQEWILERGDMLYLPPGVAHYGVALEPCMTWSIGFRSPSCAELLADFAGWLAQRAGDESHLADPDLSPDEADQGLISEPALDRALAIMTQYMSPDRASMRHWFGRFMTEPKPWLRTPLPPVAMDAAALLTRLREDRTLCIHPWARLAWARDRSGPILFADGEALSLPAGTEPLARALCSRQRVQSTSLGRYLGDPSVADVICRLFNLGILTFDAE
ncbi:MAG: cupin domain-containing protein [Gammaproteobacteria bacterium]